eukprot:TRINITY_DN2555_c0_g1_i4.p2 TRINITY_DN2555_c0_g1~~TRINITY_DN2555_c0_g1_i4.p2  ORF type:complete len:361 (+),score=23.10 TRINITY_DN2555_c0_g1_i4:115-1197(+)
MTLSDQSKGLILAISSSAFIGASYVIKKRGLRIAGAGGLRAGAGGYTYLLQPIWWAGLMMMIVGELANFSAYAFAPAILVTPMGALSIVVSAILAQWTLGEKLNIFGYIGCWLCIIGSVTIVLHSPEERQVDSVLEIWELVMQPGFMAYTILAIISTIFLIFILAPQYGERVIFVYVAICSIMGSLSVMSCKALGIAIKLSVGGNNQMLHRETWYFVVVVVVCIVTQMNYLNKALDLFNTAIVSPIYYVMFTVLTIIASIILFQEKQTANQIFTELAGFLTIVPGTFILHLTHDMDIPWRSIASMTLPVSDQSQPGVFRVQHNRDESSSFSRYTEDADSDEPLIMPNGVNHKLNGQPQQF